MTPVVGPSASLPPQPRGVYLPELPIAVATLRGVSEAFPARMVDTAARKAGLRYEAKAKIHLAEVLPGVKMGAWFSFVDQQAKARQCQIDALYLRPDQKIATVIEIKRNHTADAWWQLRRLYVPVVKEAFGCNWNVNIVEMVHTYNSAVAFPEPTVLVEELFDYTTRVRPPEVGVYRWRD